MHWSFDGYGNSFGVHHICDHQPHRALERLPPVGGHAIATSAITFTFSQPEGR
ncbi:hypothetical protein ACWATR_39100 [Nostoc sp. UIC 10890]